MFCTWFIDLLSYLCLWLNKIWHSLVFLCDWQGNTAVYLLYAHARICSIIRKSGRDIEELKKVKISFVLIEICLPDFVCMCFLGGCVCGVQPMFRSNSSCYYCSFVTCGCLKVNAFGYWICRTNNFHNWVICNGQVGGIVLAHPDERALGLHLLQFAEVSRCSIVITAPWLSIICAKF